MEHLTGRISFRQQRLGQGLEANFSRLMMIVSGLNISTDLFH